MDVAVFAVVLVALAAFVSAPLYRPTLVRTGAPTADPGADAALSALGELEVDRESGLVDQASYETERAALEGQLGGD
jgi:hypothetical protein